MKAQQTATETPSAPGRLVRLKRESTDTTSHRVLGWALFGVLLTGVAIEVALGVRVWSQITGNASPSGLAGLAYSASDTLVGPFRGYEPSTPLRTTSILEIASLVAMIAYMAATVVSLVVLTLVRYTLSHGAARRMQSVWLPVPAGAQSAASSAIKLPKAEPAVVAPVAVPAARATSPAATVREPIATDAPAPSVAA